MKTYNVSSLSILAMHTWAPMMQGVFTKLFGLLEETCHNFDLQLAYIYTSKEERSSSNFTKYATELQKLRIVKAKLAEAQELMAAFEEAVTYVVLAYGVNSPVTQIVVQQAEDMGQSGEKMVRIKQTLIEMITTQIEGGNSQQHQSDYYGICHS